MAGQARVIDQEAWPSGLRIVVVENNSLYLLLMQQLLLQCDYSVTTHGEVHEAISYVMNNQQSVDLIISDVFSPSEDGLLILKEITLKLDIPTVMMSWIGDTSTVMKYIAYGACDFLIKPVRVKELKNIWQHVFRKQIGEQRKDETSSKLDVMSASCFRRRSSSCFPSAEENIDTRESHEVMITDIRDLKKSRMHWTRQLHHQFVAATNLLGLDKAVPKKILEIMKVEHLTREQVASHLQKYRLRMKKYSSSLAPKQAEKSSNSEDIDASYSHRFEPQKSSSSFIHMDKDERVWRQQQTTAAKRVSPRAVLRAKSKAETIALSTL